MSGGAIFVSYRHEDSPHAAGRLVDRLGQAFSREQLFLDVDNIELGVDFVKVIGERVAVCDVMLAVIGPRWLDACDEEGRRRIDDPHDFVHIEIAQALARDIRVIPVLVDGAQVPRPEQLPVPLQPLTRRQASRISHERFSADADRIVSALSSIVPPRQTNPQAAPGGAQRPTPRDEPAPTASRPAPAATSASARVTPELIARVAASVGSLKSTYYAPDIPPQKAESARRACQISASEPILVLFDDTLFGGAKDSLVICPSGLFYHPIASSPEYATWDAFLANPIETGWLNGVHFAGRRWGLAIIHNEAAQFLKALQAAALAAG